ncbi:hypothetical protein [Actinospica robiniae]|uniref:hypothetical protein n=1 Tax=Actinospica robiniae TaxID=304901 RepID=UPI000408CE8C|nr:hypothetical protein [Actinospica robiniae]
MPAYVGQLGLALADALADAAPEAIGLGEDVGTVPGLCGGGGSGMLAAAVLFLLGFGAGLLFEVTALRVGAFVADALALGRALALADADADALADAVAAVGLMLSSAARGLPTGAGPDDAELGAEVGLTATNTPTPTATTVIAAIPLLARGPRFLMLIGYPPK